MRRGKSPQNINEEVNKMRRLMNFDISQNSHDVLSEQNINSIELFEKQTLLEQDDVEPNWEWIEKVLKEGYTDTKVIEDCFWVGGEDPLERISGTFNATVETGSSAVEDFMKLLIEKIESSEGAKKMLGKGGSFVIKEMDIIAGASNHIDGSITPTMDNNYNPINITKGSEEDLSYDHSIDSKNYNTNMGYAQGRGEGVKNGLLAAFNSDEVKGFSMDSDKINVSTYIIDTGGLIDEDPNQNSDNPGQVVLVRMYVCWRDEETTYVAPIYEKFNRCMTDLSVELNFNPKKQGRVGHVCNSATFEVYVNDVPLTRTHYGIGNSKSLVQGGKAEMIIPNKSKGHIEVEVPEKYASLNNKAFFYDPYGRGVPFEQMHGTGRWNRFELSDDEVASLIDVNNLRKYKGEIQVQAKCFATGSRWSDKREKVFIPNENFSLPKTNIVRYKTPDGIKTGYLYTNKIDKEDKETFEKYRSLGDGKKSYSPNLLWIAIALKYSDKAGILPTDDKGYIPKNVRDELNIPYDNITWLMLGRDIDYIEDRKVRPLIKKIQKDLIKVIDDSGRMEDNPNKGQKGCHEGVAEVVLNYYGNEQETELVTTPRFPSDGVINLGTPMEGCKKEWVKLVEASKKIAKEG